MMLVLAFFLHSLGLFFAVLAVVVLIQTDRHTAAQMKGAPRLWVPLSWVLIAVGVWLRP